MAAKGTAGKSASGASMSKYDMEVEERLQALEASVHKHDGGSSDATLEEKVEKKLHSGCKIIRLFTDINYIIL